MVKKSSLDHIPPLRKNDGSWALSAFEKAEAVSESFQKKFHLPPNLETEAPTIDENFEYGFLLVRKRWTQKLLNNLSESSATGPDGLPSIILKKCARELAYPITKLIRLILNQGKWPSCWKVHWVLPLYKRKSRSAPGNYRGIHLTNQLSKVAERFIGKLF